MTTIFLFPGQGSQAVGMLRALIAADPSLGALLARSDKLLGRDLSRLIARGPLIKLTSTENAQPAIAVASAICLDALRRAGIDAAAVAGHSLGEFTACYAAGAIDFDSLVMLAALRGRLMHEAAQARPGSMLAVLGLERDAVLTIVADAAAEGIICLANENAPHQFILSGEVRALARAADLAGRAGAREYRTLAVSGAWHSPLMDGAQARFADYLADVGIVSATVPLYDASEGSALTSGVSIRTRLAEQMTAPIRWMATLQRLQLDIGASAMVEVGPGKVLRGLALANRVEARLFGSDSLREIEAFKRNVTGGA